MIGLKLSADCRCESSQVHSSYDMHNTRQLLVYKTPCSSIHSALLSISRTSLEFLHNANNAIQVIPIAAATDPTTPEEYAADAAFFAVDVCVAWPEPDAVNSAATVGFVATTVMPATADVADAA